MKFHDLTFHNKRGIVYKFWYVPERNEYDVLQLIKGRNEKVAVVHERGIEILISIGVIVKVD